MQSLRRVTVAHKEVLDIEVSMLGQVEVLLRNEYTLFKDVLVDLLAIGFWDEHCRELLALFGKSRTMASVESCRGVVVQPSRMMVLNFGERFGVGCQAQNLGTLELLAHLSIFRLAV